MIKRRNFNRKPIQEVKPVATKQQLEDLSTTSSPTSNRLFNVTGKIGTEDASMEKLPAAAVPAIIIEDVPEMVRMDGVETIQYLGSKDIPRVMTPYPVVNANMYTTVQEHVKIYEIAQAKGIKSESIDWAILGHIRTAIMEQFSRRMNFVYNTMLMATMSEAQNWLNSRGCSAVNRYGNHLSTMAADSSKLSNYNPFSGRCIELDNIVRCFVNDIEDILGLRGNEKVGSPARETRIQEELHLYMLAAEGVNMDKTMAAIVNEIFDAVSVWSSTIIFGIPEMPSEEALEIYASFLDNLTAYLNSYVPSIVTTYVEAMEAVREIIRVRVSYPDSLNCGITRYY